LAAYHEHTSGRYQGKAVLPTKSVKQIARRKDRGSVNDRGEITGWNLKKGKKQAASNMRLDLVLIPVKGISLILLPVKSSDSSVKLESYLSDLDIFRSR